MTTDNERTPLQKFGDFMAANDIEMTLTMTASAWREVLHHETNELRTKVDALEAERDEAEKAVAAAHRYIVTAELRLAIAVRALEEIDALDIPSFDGFPPDWREQIETCPECQGWAKHHPIQQGICDEHRRPLWARERHEKQERAAIGPRAQVIAHTILAQIAKENTDAAS